jgi:hypothetical protein
MNNNWMRSFFLIAAAVTATATTASAQDVTLRATVPFRFSVNRSANLAPGNYVVLHRGNFWWFRSEDSSKAVAIATAIPKQDQPSQLPSITFTCLRARCEVQAIHVGYGSLGVELPVHKLSKSDAEELAFVSVPLEANQPK